MWAKFSIDNAIGMLMSLYALQNTYISLVSTINVFTKNKRLLPNTAWSESIMCSFVPLQKLIWKPLEMTTNWQTDCYFAVNIYVHICWDERSKRYTGVARDWLAKYSAAFSVSTTSFSSNNLSETLSFFLGFGKYHPWWRPYKNIGI